MICFEVIVCTDAENMWKERNVVAEVTEIVKSRDWQVHKHAGRVFLM